MLISRYLIWFFVYSFLGWIYESAYCTIKEQRWENRGFLYGPICPIYGVAATAMLLVIQALHSAGVRPEPWQVFTVSALGSAVLEYVTSWGLETLFHARWWDYRDMPLNLNGRICLPATLLFGGAGLLLTYVLYEPSVAFISSIPSLAAELVALVCTALMAADTALTVSALTRFAAMARELNHSVNAHMEEFVSGAFQSAQGVAGQFQNLQTRGGEAMSSLGAAAGLAASQLQKQGSNAVASLSNAAGQAAARGSEAVSSLGAAAGQAAARGSEAVSSLGAAAGQAASQLQKQGADMLESFNRERERFAQSLRASRLGSMSQDVRSAAARIRSFTPPQIQQIPYGDELKALWEELENSK